MIYVKLSVYAFNEALLTPKEFTFKYIMSPIFEGGLIPKKFSSSAIVSSFIPYEHMFKHSRFFLIILSL